MIQLKNAAGAALQNIWPHGLRITESAESRSQASAHRSIASSQKHASAIYMSLTTAWKWLEGRRRIQLASRRLRVTETLSLGEKRTLSIVTVDGAQFLIGSSAAGVQMLTKLEQTGPQSTAAAGQGREWGS